MNDLPRCELERRSSQHKGIFFEVAVICSKVAIENGTQWWYTRATGMARNLLILLDV